MVCWSVLSWGEQGELLHLSSQLIVLCYYLMSSLIDFSEATTASIQVCCPIFYCWLNHVPFCITRIKSFIKRCIATDTRPFAMLIDVYFFTFHITTSISPVSWLAFAQCARLCNESITDYQKSFLTRSSYSMRSLAEIWCFRMVSCIRAGNNP